MIVREVASDEKPRAVAQIERGQRADVVEVPRAPVFPRHAGLKLRGDVFSELGNRASEIADGRACFEISAYGRGKSGPKLTRDTSF